ncbi:MAG: cupin domain-containing protein [Firmicutes bacterium]|nr:cupin domain-containing protein [Bacillota bacterium]
MIEKLYTLINYTEKSITKIIDDDNVGVNHMVLPKGDALPEHFSNSHLYMIILKGNMTIKLDDQEPHQYNVGDIINIPFHTKMNVYNTHDPILEFLVFKAPNPRNYVRK